MTKNKNGIAHLSILFALAILLIVTTWIAGQQTQVSSKASSMPRDYYGIVRHNNYLDCASRFHLVNLEEDEVAHCLVVSRTAAANDQPLAELENQNVKIYGEIFEIGGNRHLLIQSIEKSLVSYEPSWKNRFLDVLGDFIERVLR